MAPVYVSYMSPGRKDAIRTTVDKGTFILKTRDYNYKNNYDIDYFFRNAHLHGVRRIYLFIYTANFTIYVV